MACVEDQYGVAPATPPNWTALYRDGRHFGTGLFYRISDGTDDSPVSFTIPSGNNVSAAMVLVSGNAPSAPAWSHWQTIDRTAYALPLTPHALGALPLACFEGKGGSDGSFTTAGAWTTVAQNGGLYDSSWHAARWRTTTLDAVTTSATYSIATGQVDVYGVLVAPAQPGSRATAPPLGIRDVTGATSNGSQLTSPWRRGTPQAGNLLVACLHVPSQSAVRPPPQWTQIESRGAATSSDTSITLQAKARTTR